MSKSATEVIQAAIFSAVIDAVTAIKENSKGMPNTLMRDINALHSNSTFSDLPEHLQTAIRASISNTFNRLRKEGYAVSPATMTRNTPRPAPKKRHTAK